MLLMLLSSNGKDTWATDYVPVRRPNIGTPAFSPRKLPLRQTAPAKPSVSREVKIPSFVSAQNEGSNETAANSGKSDNCHLFGTIEFKKPLDTLPGWLDVIKRNSQDYVFVPDKTFIASTTWEKLKAQAQNLDIMGKLRLINEFWNRQPYREDIVNWHKEDYWAIPAQFIRKSGDCEDYAIAKYFTLKELGVDPSRMRIVVLWDNIRNLAHAVLAVYVNEEIYILDNVSNVILSHSRIRNYKPQFSVNEFGRWAHIRGTPVKSGK